MCLIDTQLTAGEVLRVFHRDEPYLILGSAFSTVAVISVGFCVIRRRLDRLLIWLAVFAHLYGQRLWMNSGLLRLTIPDSEFFHRLAAATDYLVPIPAVLFFHAGGFLGKRWGKRITYVLVLLFSGLVIGTATFGTLHIFRLVNNSAVIAFIAAMMVLLFTRRSVDRDFVVLRFGLAAFGLLAIADNLFPTVKVEPYGFAVMLSCFGYVAGRRMLQREEEFGEIQRELELARRIQLSLLPDGFPDSPSFRFGARYLPMQAVAGDLYDVFSPAPDRQGLLIADVSGHGVPAALIAAMVKMAAASHPEYAPYPAKLLGAMNQALFRNTQGQYVTAAYVWMDGDEGEIRYAAAGHPSMLMLRNGTVTEIAENGILLAAVDSVVYTERRVALEPGDRMLLYTDGVVEARNWEGRMYGEEALMALLAKSRSLTAADAADAIVEGVQAWARNQDDDLTVVVFDFLGKPASGE